MRPKTSKAVLEQSKTPAFLVSDPLHVQYLTGFPGSGGVVLAHAGRLQFFLGEADIPRVRKLLRGRMLVRTLGSLDSALRSLSVCGFEADRVAVARIAAWRKKFPSLRFVGREGVIENFRRQKDAEELRLIRRAERITREMLRRVPAALRRGITEMELAKKLNIWALELGADGLAFDTIVGFGTHTSIPHHVATNRALKKGHIVQIDVGAQVAGYKADMSRVYFTAPPTDQQKFVYETLLDTQEKSIAAVKVGVTNHALDRLARGLLKKHGMDRAFTHSLGHGVGLEIHEGVTLSLKRSEMALLKNEVITIEPGVYFEGKFGMRVEDMVYV